MDIKLSKNNDIYLFNRIQVYRLKLLSLFLCCKIKEFQNSFNYHKAATDCNYSLAAGLSVYLRIWCKAHKRATETTCRVSIHLITWHGIYTYQLLADLTTIHFISMLYSNINKRHEANHRT